MKKICTCGNVLNMKNKGQKQCSECGKTWGIAKKICTCGKALVADATCGKAPVADATCGKTLVADANVTNDFTRNSNDKECPKCKLKWPNAKRFCTCGYTFTTGKRKSFAIRSRPKCRICGAMRKGHVCQKKP